MSGFLDPLAEHPSQRAGELGYPAAKIVWKLRPYVSLDPELVERRARRALAAPPSVTLSLKDMVIQASGEADASWLAQARARAPALLGVTRVDLKNVVNTSERRLRQIVASIESTTISFGIRSSKIKGSDVASLKAMVNELFVLADRTERQVTLSVDVDPWRIAKSKQGLKFDQDLAVERVKALRVVLAITNPEELVLRRVMLGDAPSSTSLPYASIDVTVTSSKRSLRSPDLTLSD